MRTIRPPAPRDDTDLSVLLVSTFDQSNEWNLVRELREAGNVAIELVAAEPDGLVGHVCLSRLDSPEGWLALAPICVRNENQRQGVGGDLIGHALEAARQARFAAVVVVGDPGYYARHGFVFGWDPTLETPYPLQFTGVFPVRPGTLPRNLKLVYPAPFEAV